MLGMVLLYVGAVLIINGLVMLGRISTKESVIMNVFTGGVAILAAAYNAFIVADLVAIKNASLGLLFAFTYLWVAYNVMSKSDGRGLGWFSLFVAITVLPVFYVEYNAAQTTIDYWLALNWGAWAVLWYSFFMLNVQKRTDLTQKVGYLAVAQGIITGWMPGMYLLMHGGYAGFSIGF